MTRKSSNKDYSKKLTSAYAELKKAYRQLRDSHIEMIFRLALTAEYRDVMTGTHLVRIADYSEIIADGLGLPRHEVEIIRYASPMHDIGKVILPDSILKKKGKLNSSEWKLVKKHPAVGGEIFKNAKTPILQACGIIASTHHEKFDGTGYPRELKGKRIPLYGRIVGLADYFDALTSKRPYKRAFPFDRSVSMILENAGSFFDPAIVIAFMRNKSRIKDVWKANQDIEKFLRGMEISEDELLK
ncbi:MAG: HD domain-containing phosphohydrolase, partial [Candidatus Omnitrophota bacterium]